MNKESLLEINSWFDPLVILFVIMGIFSFIYLIDFRFLDSMIFANELISRSFMTLGLTFWIYCFYRIIKKRFEK